MDSAGMCRLPWSTLGVDSNARLYTLEINLLRELYTLEINLYVNDIPRKPTVTQGVLSHGDAEFATVEHKPLST